MPTADFWEDKYRELKAEHDDQAKTVNFQKAKIAALQTELEETLQQMAQKEIEVDASESNKANNPDKKSLEKINQL